MHTLQPALSFVLDGMLAEVNSYLFFFGFLFRDGIDPSLWLRPAPDWPPLRFPLLRAWKQKLLTCVSFQLPQVEKHSAEHVARLFYSLTLWTAAGWSRRRGMLDSSFLAPSTRRGASPLIPLFLPFIALLLFLLLGARLRFSSAVLLKATHEYGLTSEKRSPRTLFLPFLVKIFNIAKQMLILDKNN